MKDFTSKVGEYIDKHCLLSPGDSVLVALSGGADSVALLLTLDALGLYKLSAAHLNHMIRGAEADGDESFCRRLCERLGIPFYSRREDIPAISAASGESTETCARRIRYRFLEESAHGAMIATAHNADDNTETLLMNIGRGAGLSGLRGIPVKRGNIIRPILCVTRADIIAFLGSLGQDYRTDSTNLIDDCTRNAIRHTVVAPYREIFPSVGESVARLTESISQDEDFISSVAEEKFREYQSGLLSAYDIPMLHPAVEKRVLVSVAMSFCKSAPENVHISELCRLAQSRRGISALPDGVFLTVRDGRFARYGGEPEPFCSEPFRLGSYVLWNRYRVTAEKLSTDDILCHKINKSASFAVFSCDIIYHNLLFRTRREGDRITLTDRRISKTLKKLYNEKHIPAHLRSALPILCADGIPVWVAGITSSGAFPPENGKEALRLSVEEIFNDEKN